MFVYHHSQKIIIPKGNVVIGDSNTRNSVNDSIFANFSNYSVGGESYLFANAKLNVLAKNNKIDTLILAFSPHNIINNGWMTFDKGNSPIRYRMPEYYYDFSVQDHLTMLKTIPFSYLKSVKFIGKNEIESIFHPSHNPLRKLGFFTPVKPDSKKNPKNEKGSEEVAKLFKNPKITELEISYLDKIVQTCGEKNIKLILMCTPKNFRNKDYALYNTKIFSDFYYSHYNTIDFLNFSEFPLPESDFADISHVNEDGANKFSHFLKKEGIKKLLNSSYNLIKK